MPQGPRATAAEISERSRIDKKFKKAPDPEADVVGYLACAGDKEWDKLQRPAKKGTKHAAAVVRLGEHLAAAIVGSKPAAANTGITDVPATVELSDGPMDAAFDAKLAQVRSRDRVMVSYPNADWIDKRKQARDQNKLYVTFVIHPGFPGRSQRQGHQQGRIVLRIGGGDTYFPKDGAPPTLPPTAPPDTMIDLGPISGKMTDFVKDKQALGDMRAKARAGLKQHSRQRWEARVEGEQIAVLEVQGATLRPKEFGGLLKGALKAGNPEMLAELRRLLQAHDALAQSQNTGAQP
ncbi:hypothetical protein R5W23_005879 [Gemmata sp. JC673]|uniref:Uncharacterized protein n=1 Tax=Gemmata algarum TaxID=2975278 RepID=A0ABU5EW84_9BACT|nr:hypothetical protein [Gemmata algarum]MDY3558722.1 hypothetical protein [Gemmata algarum]